MRLNFGTDHILHLFIMYVFMYLFHTKYVILNSANKQY